MKCYIVAQLHKDSEDFKYILEVDDNTSLDEIVEFKNDFLQDKIEQTYLKSEKLSFENEKWESTNLDKIVSKNYEKKVKGNGEDYMLMVIDSNEDINSKILIHFMNLIKNNLPDLKIGIMDYSKNETPLVKT